MKSILDISIGEKVPKIATAIIEIPQGSRVKYEIDKETGLIKIDRVLYSPFVYPANYGFFPQTWWEDGDPLDVLVISYEPWYPGVLVDVRPIGLMKMEDSGEIDDKVIAVPADDPRFNEVEDIKDLPQHLLKEIEHFFNRYKELQGKETKVLGFFGKEKAEEAILAGIDKYKKHFNKV